MHNPWRDELYRMRGVPLPIYLFRDAALPAASLWAGARCVVRDELERIDPDEAVALPGAPSPRWLHRAVAALTQGRRLLVAQHRATLAKPAGDARITSIADGVATALDYAMVRRFRDRAGAIPASITLPARDWHEPTNLLAVLASLITPTHVICDTLTEPDA